MKCAVTLICSGNSVSQEEILPRLVGLFDQIQAQVGLSFCVLTSSCVDLEKIPAAELATEEELTESFQEVEGDYVI